MTPKVRVVGRRVVVLAVVVMQLGLVVSGYRSDHKPFAFQMFPESSTWRADVVRVTSDGRRVPIERPWSGYRWEDLVPNVGLRFPSIRHHADAGLANQLAFLESALDWVADNTPRDDDTRYLEATVVPSIRDRLLRLDPTDARHRRWRAVVRGLDWLARFRVEPAPPGSRLELVDRDGSVIHGGPALALTLSRLPLTAWFALPALLLPSIRRARRGPEPG